MNYHCTICDYKTSIHSNYKKHLKTQKHISKDEKNVKNMEESIKNMEKSITNEVNRTDITNPLQCQWCTRIFCRSDVLKNHFSRCKMRSVQKNPEVSKKMEKSINNYQCQYCQNYYSNTRSLNKHVKLCFQKKSELENLKENNREIINYPKVINKLSYFKESFECINCNKIFKYKSNLSRHKKSCSKDKNIDKDNEIEELKTQISILKIENKKSNSKNLKSCSKKKNDEINKIKMENEINMIRLKYENEQAINLQKDKIIEEKDKRLADKDTTIEIAKQSRIININHTNKTINFLNSQFGDMIAMEHFLKSLEHTHQLTLQERQDLLNAYYECGIDVFARNFSYIMKQNCKRQLEDQGIKDMKLIPLFCSDGNLRSHKEKQLDGWKTLYNNQSINRMINISNQQIHESYQKIVPVSGKERNKIYNEIKKNNHKSNLLELKSED